MDVSSVSGSGAVSRLSEGPGGIAVAKKSLDQVRQEGEDSLKLIRSASGKGQLLNVYA